MPTVPLKDYIYLGAILVLLAAFAAFVHHERDIGATKVKAAVAAAVTKANAIVKTDDATAATTESKDALIYEKAVAVPAIGDIGIVCQRAAPRPVSLPAADAKQAAAVGNDAADVGVGPKYDPTGAALTLARQYDAEVIYLQDRVHELEQQMNSAP